LGWLIWQIDWQPITSALRTTHAGWFLAALLLYGVAQVVSSYRWGLLAQPLGFHAPLTRYVGLYFVGMFFSLFLPTSMGGDVVRAWRLAGGAADSRRAPQRALLSVFSERFCGLLALVLLACVVAACAAGQLPAWMLLAVAGLGAGSLTGLALLPLVGRYSVTARKAMQALSLSRGERGRWGAAFGLSLLVQAAAVLEVWFLARALALPASLLVCGVVVPLVSLLSLLPVSVNGIGVREASLVLLLAPAGVDSAAAVSLGVLWFCLLLVASLPGGLIFLFQGSNPALPKVSHGRIGGDSDQGRARKPAAAA